MDGRKILNSDTIGLSPYNKMEEEHLSQNQLNSGFNNNQPTAPQTRGCKWPHQWTLNECCCGCTLRNGCLWIGWGFMLTSSFMLLGSLIAPVPTLLRWEDVIFTCLKLISSIVLLVGVYKHHLKTVRASVFLSLIDIVAEVVLAVVFSIQILYPLPVLVLIFILPLSIYLLVVVNSYANQMAAGLMLPNTLPPGMNV